MGKRVFAIHLESVSLANTHESRNVFVQFNEVMFITTPQPEDVLVKATRY